MRRRPRRVGQGRQETDLHDAAVEGQRLVGCVVGRGHHVSRRGVEVPDAVVGRHAPVAPARARHRDAHVVASALPHPVARRAERQRALPRHACPRSHVSRAPSATWGVEASSRCHLPIDTSSSLSLSLPPSSAAPPCAHRRCGSRQTTGRSSAHHPVRTHPFTHPHTNRQHRVRLLSQQVRPPSLSHRPRLSRRSPAPPGCTLGWSG